MAWWGSGTAEDPWKVTDWDSFVAKCQYTSDPTSTMTYIVFPTHDQNGNLIPVEERVIDMRHHDWYVDRRDASSIIVLSSLKDVEGNGWTILGLSLRNSYLFRNNFSSSGSSSYNRGTNTVIKNLNFQNIYCHGCVYLFNTNSNGSRITVTGCKFSGVWDNSIVDPYSTSSGSTAGSICTNTSYTGWNVFTACSFNFKFINLCKTITYTGSSGSYTARVEFNNCLFNAEGKVKSTNSSAGDSTSDSAKYNMFFGYLYFCKMTGRIILENAEADGTTAYAYLYHNQGGSLNVIDFKLKSTRSDYFNYNYWLLVRTRNTSEVTIAYFEYESGFSTVGWNVGYKGTPSAFKIPTNRTQMTDKDWLELQGFVIGTAPTI